MDTGTASSSRGNQHQAQLIPGVDGHRIFGFPNSIITKLRYCDNIALTGTSGARGVNVFAANGLYDPDITGVGHQPMYYDNYTAIYDQYVVIGSKITVHFSSTTASVPVIVGIVGDDDSTISTVVTTLMEQNNSIYTLMSEPGGGQIRTLSQTFEPLQDIGIDAKDDGASSTQTTANPTELWCYGVWAAAADASSTVNVKVTVEIEYTVKFTELKTPIQN